MTGLDGKRVYLDWNASTPLRPEARAAMLAAMDVVGNPSSVHAEGRVARAIVEKARGQVADLAGCTADAVVFTSGATEAAAMLLHGAKARYGTEIDHDCTFAWLQDPNGAIAVRSATGAWFATQPRAGEVSIQTAADGETGILVDDFARRARQVEEEGAGWFGRTAKGCDGLAVLDMTQLLGRVPRPCALVARSWKYDAAIFSAHKMGGPKGVGCAVIRGGREVPALLRGGGQEKGRRSGTENVIGIAGFGAAAEAAQRDLEAGVWDRVKILRDLLEEKLADAAPDTILFGRGAPRLPNTACFAVPGWAGETQVMQMDLAGFAISAGSACSSGRVKKASRVLLAMGFDEETASSAIRVSLGPTTTEAEVVAFVDAWIDAYRRQKSRAA